ncbi:serine/threonine-protein kinase [Micromonospora siamensis]|uniref:non-specific serine/threonine protein kinase n=1 Tax=Micromonospora siamensis TaxID=299152 RepID=A0A1C5HCL2_9ACTN|nr:serine/threonine-protein kinase [Micromonospora siamensis]SCG43769.1 Protein kinase domain-containing protein [Micromonospora siamensis]
MSNALPQLVADRYRLLSPLGQGGMGRVWKARDEVLHRDVAIKELVPPPSLTDDERREMRERSLREARAIARLNNINVVRIFDVLRTDGDPWIVMEYVPSKSLQDTLAEDGPVSPARAVEIGLGVLGALKAAHKAGVMHRDIKPGNVLLGNDGRVVLTDFGLATIPGDPNVTRTGMVLGSPAYIAPERAKDGTAGPEADLWSLGATLYAAVEGKSPYARPSAIATLAALATEPLPPPKNAGPLKPVLNGLLRKDPAERITAEVAERLLRRAGGKRAKSIAILDGVRRPGPNGPRAPHPPVVPGPRPAETSSAAVPKPPSSATVEPTDAVVGAAAAGAVAEDATAKVPASVDAGPTAKVESPPSRSDAEPTAKVDAAPQVRETVNPTSVMPAQADPVEGRATVVPGVKPDHKRRNLLIGALVAVLLLGGVLLVPLLNDDPGDKGSTPPQTGPTTGASGGPGGGQGGPAGSPAAPSTQASTSAAAPPPAPSTAASSAAPPSATPSPAQPSSGTPALPAGWTLQKGGPGFSVPLPAGWSGRQTSGDTAIYNGPDGGRLLIQWTNKPKDDAYADWQSIERYRKNEVDEYEKIGIKRCTYYRTCADWDWLETQSGTRYHVRNRGFATADDRGYALRWEIPTSQWDAKLGDWATIIRGFQPDRKN